MLLNVVIYIRFQRNLFLEMLFYKEMTLDMKLWGVNDKVTMCFSYLLREPLTVLWRWH